MSIIATIEDVADHLGAGHPTTESISRAVYKNTDCGAWAAVETRAKVEKRTETWRVRYARVEGAWQVLSAERDGTPVEFSAMPLSVRNYFYVTPCANGAHFEAVLKELAGPASDYEAAATEPWEYPVGQEVVFRCGSIVEGCDGEVFASPVTLPCAAKDIDAAIQYVEDEAALLWDQTHGCEECARINGHEWEPGATVVLTECAKCGGHGIAI